MRWQNVKAFGTITVLVFIFFHTIFLAGCQSPRERHLQDLKSQDSKVRLKAVKALGELKDPNTVDVLITTLKKDRDKPVRVAAANVLGELKAEKAVDALAFQLKYDRSQFVNIAAARALAKIGGTAVTALISIAKEGKKEAKNTALMALNEVNFSEIDDPKTAEAVGEVQDLAAKSTLQALKISIDKLKLYTGVYPQASNPKELKKSLSSSSLWSAKIKWRDHGGADVSPGTLTGYSVNASLSNFTVTAKGRDTNHYYYITKEGTISGPTANDTQETP